MDIQAKAAAYESLLAKAELAAKASSALQAATTAVTDAQKTHDALQADSSAATTGP